MEHKHRHIVESGLTLTAQASIPLHYWGDAFFTAVFLLNRLPTKSLSNVSPHEMLFNKHSNYMFLHVFGCLCFPHLRLYNTHKLAFQSSPCVFLDYCSSYHVYRCLHASGRVYISRHVIFHENVFPFANMNGACLRSAAMTNTYTSFPFFLPFDSTLLNDAGNITQSLPDMQQVSGPLYNPTPPSQSMLLHYPLLHQFLVLLLCQLVLHHLLHPLP